MGSWSGKLEGLLEETRRLYRERNECFLESLIKYLTNTKPYLPLKVVEDEFIPADILLLNSSDSKGAAYIETKSLDGETNLKFKKVHKDLFESYKDENNLQKADFHFKYEGPNVYLYKFNGKYT